MQDMNPLTLYKLIILYMLDSVDFSLTKTQIFDFMLDKEYTDYFKLQSIIYELTEDKLVDSEFKRNASYLEITDKGRETISSLNNLLSDSIKEELNSYLKDKELQLRNEVSIQANYYKSTVGEYVAELVAKEKNVELLNIKIAMPTEEAAVSICDNWEVKNQEIYAYLIESLLR